MSSINKQTILLVEDEAVTSVITSRTLNKFGYNVVTANSGEKAVETVSKIQDINIILMDIELGDGIDGTEAAEKILKKYDKLLIFFSNHTEPEIVEKAEKISSYGYILKNSCNTVLKASLKMASKLFEIQKKIGNELVERKRIEDGLLESKERYRLIFENSPLGFLTFDENGIIVTCNDNLVKIFGLEREKLIGLNLINLPDVKMVASVKKALNGSYGLYEDDYCPESGDKATSLRILFASIGSESGKICGGVGIIEDISERKNKEKEIFEKKEELSAMNKKLEISNEELSATIEELGSMNEEFEAVNEQLLKTNEELKETEKALRQSEAQYRLLADHMRDAIWLLDKNLNITYRSPSTYKSRGYTVSELPAEIDKNIAPATLELIMKIFKEEKAKVVKNPDYTPFLTLELEFYCKDGSTMWMECTFSLIRDINKKPLYILGEGRDITDRKKIEEEKKIIEEQLQQAEKLDAIGKLAGGIAHDFNNLLMGIRGYTSLLMMNIKHGHPDYEMLKRIDDQVESGADLTRQLLGYARGGRYEIKTTDINEIIEKTLSLFCRTKKELTVDLRQARDLWSVDVDHSQMEQVFMNLYVNAWQAMPDGGKISVKTENVILDSEQLMPDFVKLGKYVKITVSDTGTGMDVKTSNRIFDPFFTTKEMGRGTGLGLATVYGIIKGHKGIISVNSELSRGTSFIINLPASDKKVLIEKKPTGKILRGTETILLVDDEKMVLDVNRKLLEHMGYRVFSADNGQDAISVFREKNSEIDMVILDMVMPGISGTEIFNRLKDVKSDIKVMLISGYSINGEAQKIIDHGCNGFLQKPFNPEQLSLKIRDVLGC